MVESGFILIGKIPKGVDSYDNNGSLFDQIGYNPNNSRGAVLAPDEN